MKRFLVTSQKGAICVVYLSLRSSCTRAYTTLLTLALPSNWHLFKKLRFLLLGFIILPHSSCTTPQEEVVVANAIVSVNATVAEDEEYDAILKKYSRKVQAYSNFETIFFIHTTFLSKDFLKGMQKRHTQLFSSTQPYLEETNGKASLFISLFTPEEKLEELENAQLWHITLEKDGKSYVPTLVKPLRKKDRWTVFFPFIDKWSKEFLVIFDTTPGEGPIKVRLANPDGKAELSF